MKTIVITGATRGLGLAFAKQLAQDKNNKIVLAVRDLTAGIEIASMLGQNVEVKRLDMASRASIDQFIEDWSGSIDALVNNAGLQIHGPVRFTSDDDEMTLAVNHLGVLQLTLGLLPHLVGGTVLGIGSGTHNPTDRVATMFGFRGGRFSSVTKLARGEMDADTEQQAGLDRYATSKMLSMATTVEMAKRFPSIRFLTLDPGLMPGTGLVRTAPRVVQLAWKFALPMILPLMPGASTPTRSAAAGCKIMSSTAPISGDVYDFNAKVSGDVWEKVFDPEFGKDVYAQSAHHLGLETHPLALIA